MIKLCKGLYIHFSVGLVFLITYFSKTLEITAMAFITSVCHELCHLFAALILKERCHGIAVMPYGCRLYMGKIESSVKDFVIALAGPLFNVLAAVFIKEGPLRDINAAMAIINLFPVMPLDGGRMVYSFLSILKGPFFALSVMRHLSFFGGTALTILGVYQAVVTGFNLSVFTAGAFLLFSAITARGSESLYKDVLTNGEKMKNGIKKGVMLIAKESLPARKILPFIPTGKYALIKVVDGKGRVKCEMTEDEIKDKIISLGAGVRFREIT